MLSNIDVQDIIKIAKQAGDAIMEIYQKDFGVEYKADDSPLTEADKAAHDIIEAGLKRTGPTADIPILSEEGRHLAYEQRKDRTSFWLVDPLDGTKEFVKKNDEFTVNIALIHKGEPVLGVVYAPALNQLYYAKKGTGAFKQEVINGQIQTHQLPRPKKRKEGEIIVVASKSHLSEETKQFVDELTTHYPLLTTHSIGSSLKICLVAEGEADIYPRLGPTMEWDTGAAHAVVLEAGGKLERYANGEYQLHGYNKPDLLNDWFVVKNI
ncbi:MAG: 3'(2'),5'-bisphosphate nucleotidase CysQ [Hydrogenovibrio sp.]|uniref:3'(2'),5'-bisphosphate nucleotidase CysQ n=1 Tax=Hydrogenovibrio sp. TaxID=2065821 RepID=UPI00286FD962|nr:3'(2'),5'-bisphosphate nucleotidase CysQ [Hydrogenovibrio sp.]MDR9498502.1 3'(2'),5'-bisphosphate nucleotidase CysQ [Hydrogenovibrio sp.]MDR9499268.1 3'(2'),5'-bisphosphate nucleotidase CysQ [Hydrogenovibrio sp.]